MGDEDLQFEPMYRGRGRGAVIGAVVVVAIAAALFVNHRLRASRRGEARLRASVAWSALSRCLVGDGPSRGERASQLVRRIEIATWQDSRAYDRTPAARRWPARCSVPAGQLTRAMFEADPDDPDGKLFKAIASRAATALEQGELRTGEHDRQPYVDELFELARRAGLPSASDASGPLPPSPAHPLAFHALDPLLAGAGEAVFVATDPVPGNVLRLITGHEHPHLCIVREGTQLPLARAHCIGIANTPAGAALSVAGADDDAPGYVLIAADATSPRSLRDAEHRASTPRFVGVTTAWIGPRQLASSLHFTPGATRIATLDRAEADQPATSLALPSAWFGELRGEPLLVHDQLVLLDGAPAAPSPAAPASDVRDAGAPDAGAIASMRLAAATIGSGTLETVGTVDTRAEAPSLTGCQTHDATIVAIRGADDAVALSFRADGRWSQPVVAHASPQAALTCRNREATFTWAETAPHRYIHQTRCTSAGCQTAQGNLPIYDPEPVVSDLDGRVLLVATPGPRVGNGLRIRVAPIAEIDSVDDTVVFDDADHGGLTLHPIDRVFVRGAVAVVLATRAGDPEETYAIRIEPDGSFAGVQVR